MIRELIAFVVGLEVGRMPNQPRPMIFIGTE
jgi:hypothetical protein